MYEQNITHLSYRDKDMARALFKSLKTLSVSNRDLLANKYYHSDKIINHRGGLLPTVRPNVDKDLAKILDIEEYVYREMRIKAESRLQCAYDHAYYTYQQNFLDELEYYSIRLGHLYIKEIERYSDIVVMTARYEDAKIFNKKLSYNYFTIGSEYEKVMTFEDMKNRELEDIG